MADLPQYVEVVKRSLRKVDFPRRGPFGGADGAATLAAMARRPSPPAAVGEILTPLLQRLAPEQELRYEALSALIDEIYQTSVGKPWESRVSDRIFQADMWKKIINGTSEKGSAGESTLVYQISNKLVKEGLTLDIDELTADLTIDVGREQAQDRADDQQGQP